MSGDGLAYLPGPGPSGLEAPSQALQSQVDCMENLQACQVPETLHPTPDTLSLWSPAAFHPEVPGGHPTRYVGCDLSTHKKPRILLNVSFFFFWC